MRFARRTFRTFELEIRDTNLGQVINYGGVSPVGFAEIRLHDDAPGSRNVRVSEVVKMPSDLLSTVGTASQNHPLVLLMNRERVIPVPPRRDPEESMVRAFALPTARSFGLAGEARLSPFLPDDEIDRLLGYAGPVVATSSEHLSGAPQDRASAALDQDPATAWVSPFSDVVAQYVNVRLPAPVTVDHLDLQLVADGRHSVPTKIAITNERGDRREVDVPAVTDQAEPNAVAAAPVQFPAIVGSDLRVTVLAVREVTTREWYCECDLTMPVGIAELGLPGVAPVRVAAEIPDECRNDLITIDGRPVPVRVVGSTADALQPKPAVARQLHRWRCRDDVARRRPPRAADPGGQPLRLRRRPAHGRVAAGRCSVDRARRVRWPDRHESRRRAGAGGKGAGSGPGEDPGPGDGGDGALLAGPGPEQQPGVAGDRRRQGSGGVDAGRRVRKRLVHPTEWPGSGVRREHRVGAAADREPRIALSIVSVIVCLGIVFASGVRRRRRRRTEPDVVDVRGLADPTLASPLVAAGGRPGWFGISFATVMALAAGAVFVTPWVGALLGAAVLLVMLRPRWRGVLSLVPAVALAGCGAFIAAKQWYARLPATFEWPTFFWQVRTLGWIAIIFLAGDALVEIVRTRSTGRRACRRAVAADSAEVDPLRD